MLVPTPITNIGLYSGTWQIAAAHPNAGTGSVGYTANRAYFCPVLLPDALTALRMVYRGQSAAGNVDLGLYDASGNRLVSTGSIVMAAAATAPDIADTALAKGIYYMAIASNNAGARFYPCGNTVAVAYHRLAGWQIMDAAFPLPATAVFAQPTEVAGQPYFGFMCATLPAL